MSLTLDLTGGSSYLWHWKHGVYHHTHVNITGHDTDIDLGRIENAWAIHQAETTVDFARDSRVLSWLLGGLNFQVEHHLFPRICHVNYPAISKLVEETCREFGVRYAENRSFWAGIASHFRWLRRMGKPGTTS